MWDDVLNVWMYKRLVYKENLIDQFVCRIIYKYRFNIRNSKRNWFIWNIALYTYFIWVRINNRLSLVNLNTLKIIF